MSGRIVVTERRNGRSVVAFDGTPERVRRFEAVPGFETAVAWATKAGAPLEGLPVQALASVTPDAGGTRLLVVTFPPDAVMADPGFDPAAAGAEYMAHLPGLAERFEPDAPGMHRTDSLDYGIVLDGEIVLDLGDGGERRLGPGDVVVQRATRHAWRNRSTRPARVVFVMIGTDPVS